MSRNSAQKSIGVVITLVLALAACAPAATPTSIPQETPKGRVAKSSATPTLEPATEPAMQTQTPTPSATPEPTATKTLSPTATQTPPPTATQTPLSTATQTPPPTPTPDPEVVRYLRGVESILRHSARVIPGRALGLGHVCNERYIIAFPYREPDRRGGMTLAVVALEREPDGTVREREHKMIWHIGDEGLYIDRWNRITLADRSQKGQVRIQFLLQEPDGDAWQVGMASGPCPGDDLSMVGIFAVDHPENYALLFTRYDASAPLDFWLQDGDQLRRYNWEPWTGTLLWTLEETPGRMVAVEWGEDSPDLTGDGIPDMVIHWDVSGETVRWGYAADGDGFIPVGLVDPE